MDKMRVLTTEAGAPVTDNQNSRSAGPLDLSYFRKANRDYGDRVLKAVLERRSHRRPGSQLDHIISR
jgi:hypothetical protein